MADVFGRHVVLQTAIFLTLVGSVLCAAAQDFPMLLFGRAIQGIGLAGVAALTKIVLADKVSLKENSTNNTIFAFLNGFSFSVGPVIGGYLTQSNWRWCFIINIPIAVMGHIAVFWLLRKELVGPQAQITEDGNGNILSIERRSLIAKLSVVDYIGIIFFISAICLIILSITWGGATYSWHSVHVLVPLVLGGILFVVFWFWEYLMEPGHLLSTKLKNQAPMIPLNLFYDKDICILTYLNFSTGMG